MVVSASGGLGDEVYTSKKGKRKAKQKAIPQDACHCTESIG